MYHLFMENVHRVGFLKAKPEWRTWVQVISLREGGVPGIRRRETERSKIKWNPMERPVEGVCVPRLLWWATGPSSLQLELRSAWKLPELSQGCRKWGTGVLPSGSHLPDFWAAFVNRTSGLWGVRACKKSEAGVIYLRRGPVSMSCSPQWQEKLGWHGTLQGRYLKRLLLVEAVCSARIPNHLKMLTIEESLLPSKNSCICS